MKININCEKIELTNAIRGYIETKMDVLEKFFNFDTDAVVGDVIIGKTTKHHNKGNFFKAEIKINTPIKKFFASAEKDDLYASIDEVQGILKREIVKQKDILIDKSHKIDSIKS